MIQRELPDVFLRYWGCTRRARHSRLLKAGASIAANDIDIKVSISFAAMQNLAMDIDIICGALTALAALDGVRAAGANLCCRGT
jgi:hypothetical protein